jgi:ABC-type transport system substrate-binding protein
MHLSPWVLALTVATQAAPRAQAVSHRPDFSGTWTRVAETLTKSPTAKDPATMFSFGPNLHIVQTARQIQIAVWTLALDGTPSIDGEGAVSRARWMDQSLVLTEAEPAAVGKPASLHKVVLTLAKNGALTVDITAEPIADVVRLHSEYRKTKK